MAKLLLMVHRKAMAHHRQAMVPHQATALLQAMALLHRVMVPHPPMVIQAMACLLEVLMAKAKNEDMVHLILERYRHPSTVEKGMIEAHHQPTAKTLTAKGAAMVKIRTAKKIEGREAQMIETGAARVIMVGDKGIASTVKARNFATSSWQQH
jgi:hypothetical protein